MKIFSYIYDKMLSWSAHRHAPYYLAGVSFSESSFFPIPPDIMLLTMGMAKPKCAWHYALLTLIFSVLGGCFGYVIGMFFMDILQPHILASPYAAAYEHVRAWFEHWGVGVVLLAGFTPIPYKIFTIAAGAMHMAFLPFVFASIGGRGARFFLVSALVVLLGKQFEKHFRRWIDWIGWVLVIALVIGYSIIKLRG
ncbi:MAG: DedA family protein [Legionellaceae bacterium]|nr:DedA family protein [Legionellaceae bacterium]